MNPPKPSSRHRGSARLPAGRSGACSAGGPFGSGCGWSSRPTRSSSCALSPTPPPHRLKAPETPVEGLRGETTHGWIIDAYGDYDRDSMVLWLWNERGARRIEDLRVVPSFFLHAPPSELPAIRRRIEILDGVRAVRAVSRPHAREADEPQAVPETVPRHLRD